MLIERTLFSLEENIEKLTGKRIRGRDFISFSEHGDFSSNASFSVAKEAKLPPFEIANRLSECDYGDSIENSSAVKPGFLNFRFKDKALIKELESVSSDKDYGAKQTKEGKANIEFVSANPTGPLVLVNARAGVAGNALYKILKFSGFESVRETYINDSGNQVRNLGASVLFHIAEEKKDFPENGYRGEYIKKMAEKIQESRGPLEWSEENIKICAEEAKKIILEWQKKSLEKYNIEFDSWVFESFIRENYLQKALSILDEKGYTYENDNAKYLRTTDFGDDKDRVIFKSDKEMTYFLPDIAYHLYKAERGFDRIIDILGPDHHGYTSRIKASMKMLGFKARMDIIIAQIVTLYRNNEKYEMSKRSGDFISMDELAEEIDPDVMKFMVLSRKLSQPFNFDIEKAKQTTMDNPVYYVQYAYARLSSVMKNAGISGCDDISFSYPSFEDENLRKIASKLLEFPYTVYSISETYEIQKLPNYAVELSSLIHSYYYENRIITDNADLTNKRVSVMYGAMSVLKRCLDMMGITVKERMEKNEV